MIVLKYFGGKIMEFKDRKIWIGKGERERLQKVVKKLIELGYTQMTDLESEQTNYIITNRDGSFGGGLVPSKSKYFDPLPVKLWKREDLIGESLSFSKQCECGARHTSMPNWHLDWCPKYVRHDH